MDTRKSHKAFLERHARGEVNAARVATILQRWGIDAVASKNPGAPTFEQRHRFKDSGDIKVGGFIVEVKGSQYRFTCIQDWQFDYGCIVDTVKGLDGKRERGLNILGHVTISEIPDEIAIPPWGFSTFGTIYVPATTHVQWFVKTIYNPDLKRKRRFYIAPKDCFEELSYLGRELEALR